MQIKVKVNADAMERLLSFLTNEGNILPHGSTTKKAFASLLQCEPEMHPDVTVSHGRVQFKISLGVEETESNLEPLPREKLNKLLDCLGLYK